jgi:Thioesterase domain
MSPGKHAPPHPQPAQTCSQEHLDNSAGIARTGSPTGLGNLRLFCFPYAGGGTQVFRGWSDALPDSIEVHPVELPGRGRQFTTPAARRLDNLVDGLI